MADLRWDYKAFGEFLRSAEMAAEMERRIKKVEAIAIATAPVDEGGPHPGRYKSSFRTEVDRRGGAKHDRAVGRLLNDSPEALFVEYGTQNNPRHSTMRRALTVADD